MWKTFVHNDIFFKFIILNLSSPGTREVETNKHNLGLFNAKVYRHSQKRRSSSGTIVTKRSSIFHYIIIHHTYIPFSENLGSPTVYTMYAGREGPKFDYRWDKFVSNAIVYTTWLKHINLYTWNVLLTCNTSSTMPLLQIHSMSNRMYPGH